MSEGDSENQTVREIVETQTVPRSRSSTNERTDGRTFSA